MFTGNEAMRDTALRAADWLMERYEEREILFRRGAGLMM